MRVATPSGSTSAGASSPPAPRTASGYRSYTGDTVARIQLARRLQGLGLTLDEVIGALHVQDTGHASRESERWRLHAALGRIEARLAERTRLRGEVRTRRGCEAGACRVLAG